MSDDDIRNDEAWMHAACLTIAETGQKWGDNVHPSPAMRAVYDLHHDRERLRADVERLTKAIRLFLDKASCIPPWESAGAVWADMLKRLNEVICDDSVSSKR